jgi:hypothetical protein
VLGIRGYRPKPISSVRQLRELHGKRLHALVGERIQRVWLTWDRNDDSWLADNPVVLQIGDQQLELCWWKFDELFLTWNEIDLAAPLNWYGDSAFDLTWCADGHPAQRLAPLRVVREVHMTEFAFRISGVSPDRPVSTETWLFNGIQFVLDDGVLEVHNAMDENGISTREPKHEDWRRVPVTGP